MMQAILPEFVAYPQHLHALQIFRRLRLEGRSVQKSRMPSATRHSVRLMARIPQDLATQVAEGGDTRRVPWITSGGPRRDTHISPRRAHRIPRSCPLAHLATG